MWSLRSTFSPASPRSGCRLPFCCPWSHGRLLVKHRRVTQSSNYSQQLIHLRDGSFSEFSTTERQEFATKLYAALGLGKTEDTAGHRSSLSAFCSSFVDYLLIIGCASFFPSLSLFLSFSLSIYLSLSLSLSPSLSLYLSLFLSVSLLLSCSCFHSLNLTTHFLSLSLSISISLSPSVILSPSHHSLSLSISSLLLLAMVCCG